MLSSIASFLPSALHLNQGPELPRPTINPDTEDEDDEEEEERERETERERERERERGSSKTNNASGARAGPGGNGVQQPPQPPPKGKEKEKMANETFIFVRPPPSKSNHPLNLQVQLVPPNVRPPTGVTPVSGNESTVSSSTSSPTSARSTGSNSSNGGGGADLRRTNSNRSDTSFTATSYNTSTASFNSISSSTSSSASTSTRRNIIPLYNLQAHNVMTNVIVDAGTDAKIAKFQKRGIELIDLAVLEPVEVWGEKDKEKEVRRESMRISVDEMGAIMTGGVVGGTAAAGGLGAAPTAGPNARGSLLSGKIGGGFFQGGGGGSGSRPVTPSAASSATSLHSNLRHETTSIASSSSKTKTKTKTSVVPPPSPAFQQEHVQFQLQQQQQQQQQPQQKRNLFNKLFNKRNNNPASPSSPSPIPQDPADPDTPPPTFASFSLHPAPVVNRFMNIGRDKDKERGRPPPLQEPLLSPSSPNSQEATPTELSALPTPTLTSRRERNDPPVSPAVTIAPPPKEKGHGRNLSLTSAITTPFKTTLKNNRNRLSSVIGGGSNSASSGNGSGGNANLVVPGSIIDVDEAKKREVVEQQQKLFDQYRNHHQQQQHQQPHPQQPPHREASPNPSMSRSSRSQLSLHADSLNVVGQGGPPVHHPSAHQPQPQQQQFYPLVQTPTQELKNQQLQLRPPILGIQPTFVSASSSSYVPNASGGFGGAGGVGASSTTIPPSVSSPLVAALSPRVGSDVQENLLQGQRALMYVWLVRRWLKRRPGGGVGLGLGGISNPFGESGMFGGLGKSGRAGNTSQHGHAQESSSGTMGGGGGSGAGGLPYGGVEVRFEWKRAKGKDAKGSGKNKKSKRGRGGTRSSTKDSSYAAAAADGGESDPERSTRNNGNGTASRTKDKEKEKNRSESKKRASHRMSTGSLSTAATASEDGLRGVEEDNNGGGGGAGEESDPEDSETPWVCTLKIRRNIVGANDMLSPTPMPMHGRGVSSTSQSQSTQAQPQVMRVKVGTLSPTPHHPKVVAMLKIPFPLPDVEVERMGIVRRKGFPVPAPVNEHGQLDSAQRPRDNEDGAKEEPYTGLTLTAEEIKDMVCSTGLWLVVREGFGGVGRVSRKGDGWRIRA